MQSIFKLSCTCSQRLNWLIERLCALLVALMILDVWLGIVSRYLVDMQITWTEELARYIMIWAALLAISCGVYYREHVGLMLILEALPRKLHHATRLLIDLLGIAFFIILIYYGFNMTRDGATQYATIFNMTMTLPYAAVPVSAAMATLQLVLVAIKDFTRLFVKEDVQC
jgi:TRAP-type C4-dicarboxylate transport system permease small subunit